MVVPISVMECHKGNPTTSTYMQLLYMKLGKFFKKCTAIFSLMIDVAVIVLTHHLVSVLSISTTDETE